MLTRAGSATVAELAAALEVSDMTIRRDLVALAEKRLIEKVHGGAVLPRRSAIEPHFVAKRSLNAGAKEAIGARAVDLIRDGMTISLSAGTTTWQVAKQLDHRFHNLTFITNSMNVAMALVDNGWSSVVCPAAPFRTPSDTLVGPFAVQTLRQLNADLSFLGVDSLDPSVGLNNAEHSGGRDRPGADRWRPAGGGGRLEQARPGFAGDLWEPRRRGRADHRYGGGFQRSAVLSRSGARGPRR